jgi:hypothetical protein
MKKLLVIALVLTMIFTLSAVAMATGNGKTENVFDQNPKIDINNANFHCNASDGNGRVNPTEPIDMDKFVGKFTFTKAEGTTWNLIDVADKDDNSLSMVVCPECGSTEWVTFSNNSGVPDGKNIQMYHPGYDDEDPWKKDTGIEIFVDVVKQHNEITFLPVYEKTIQPVYKKEIQPVYEKIIQPVWQKTYKPFYRPAYEKKVTVGKDTLVTRLAYSDNTSKAIPTNGGTFKNGHTYVAVDVAVASAEGGVWYGIADSSSNSNGKKTPAEYNRPVDYEYNVQIADGKLTISFDDRLISASVGAYVVGKLVTDNKGNVDADKSFPGNAPKHSLNSFTVDVPENKGTIYLYFHLEGGSKWFTTGEYEFVGYRWCFDKLISDEWIRDEETEKWLRDDEEEKWLRDDVTEKFLYNKFVSKETVLDDYFVNFNLYIVGENGEVICDNEQIKNGGTLTFMGLEPGEYTCVLTGDDIEEQVKNITVVKEYVEKVVFNEATVTGETEKVYLDKFYKKETTLDKIYETETILDKIYEKDIVLDPKYLGDRHAEYLN